MLKPVISEKSYRLLEEENCYVFEGNVSDSKTIVKKKVEDLFNVNVIKVRSVVRKGSVRMNRNTRKLTQRPSRKIFYVFLKEGDSIKDFKV